MLREELAKSIRLGVGGREEVAERAGAVLMMPPYAVVNSIVIPAPSSCSIPSA
jgi:hypothetical protein